MKGTEDTLAEGVEMSFPVIETGVNHAFLGLVEMTLADMVYLGLMKEHIHNSFER